MNRQGIPDTMLQFSKGPLDREIVGDMMTMLQRAIEDAIAAVMPEYVLAFRKDGENPDPVDGPFEHFIGDPETFQHTGNYSIDCWQRYARPVWSDIRQNRTLQYTTARSDGDGRHVCPAQLDAIERGIEMYTKPGHVVLDPFSGIGSTGHCALHAGRSFIGFELKDSYYRQAVANLANAAEHTEQARLF